MDADEVRIRKVSLSDTTKVFPDIPISHRSRVYPGEFAIIRGHSKSAAIKIVPHSAKTDREVANLLKLGNHANVVRILDYGILPDSIIKTIFIAMEKCQNICLQSYYSKRKEENLPFNTKQAVEFAQQLTEGLNHIHERNIIHRDLKPGSVLFSMDGKNLKIAGFGVSKELEHGHVDMDMSTENAGTYGYRAPETYNKGLIKKSSDVFSLGIILYHVWSYGSHPFGGDHDIWSYNIKHGKIDNIRDFTKRLLIPDANNEARDLLLRMLKNKPSERVLISEVRSRRYIRDDFNTVLSLQTRIVWQGNVKGVEGMGDLEVKDCSLRMVSDEYYSGIEGFNFVGRISIVRAISMISMLSAIGGRPSGYLSLDLKANENLLKLLGMELYQALYLHQLYAKVEARHST